MIANNIMRITAIGAQIVVPPAPLVCDLDWLNTRALIPGSVSVIETKAGIAVEEQTGVQQATGGKYTNQQMLKFGGTSTLRLADHPAFNFGSGDFTIEFDFRMDNDSDWSVAYLVNKGGGLNIAWSSFLIVAHRTNRSIQLMMSTSNTKYEVGGSPDYNAGWGNYVVGKIHRIAVVRKGTTVYCFFDGALNKTFTNVTGALTPNTGRGLTLGYHRPNNWTSGAVDNVLNGCIQNLKISNIPLYTATYTPAEITLASCQTKPGVYNWEFDTLKEDNGNSQVDSNNYNVTNGLLMVPDKAVAPMYKPVGIRKMIPPNTEFTLEFLYRLTMVTSTHNYVIFFDDRAALYHRYQLNRKLVLVAYDQNYPDSSPAIVASSTPGAGTDILVKLVRDASGTITLYINGSSVGSVANMHGLQATNLYFGGGPERAGTLNDQLKGYFQYMKLTVK